MAQVFNRKRAASSTSFLRLKQHRSSKSKLQVRSGSTATTDYPKSLMFHTSDSPGRTEQPLSQQASRLHATELWGEIRNSRHMPLLNRLKATYDSYLVNLDTELLRKQQKVAELKALVEKEHAYSKQLRKRQTSMAYEALEAKAKTEKYNNALDSLQRQLDHSAGNQTGYALLRTAIAQLDKLKANVRNVQAKHEALKPVRRAEEQREELWKLLKFPVAELQQQINPHDNPKLWLEVPSFQTGDNTEFPTSHSASFFASHSLT